MTWWSCCYNRRCVEVISGNKKECVSLSRDVCHDFFYEKWNWDGLQKYV